MSKTDKTGPYYTQMSRGFESEHTCVRDRRPCNAPIDKDGALDCKQHQRLMALVADSGTDLHYGDVCWPRDGWGWKKSFPAYGVKAVRKEMNRVDRRKAKAALRANRELDELDVENKQPRSRARWECDL